MRPALVAALASCVDKSLQSKARHFLLGLSCDELEFIADYLGSCMLESGSQRCSRGQLAGRIAEFQQARQGCAHGRSADQEHKMILLLEFLCRNGMQQLTMPLRASQAG